MLHKAFDVIRFSIMSQLQPEQAESVIAESISVESAMQNMLEKYGKSSE